MIAQSLSWNSFVIINLESKEQLLFNGVYEAVLHYSHILDTNALINILALRSGEFVRSPELTNKLRTLTEQIVPMCVAETLVPTTS